MSASAALILLISKYGFGDVLKSGAVELDPSRIAAQIVSGIGFLGAGIIITRRGAVHGLTTAAAVWESAAIGMAAGAGLVGLAVVVVTLHGTVRLHIIYDGGRGVQRELLRLCGRRKWHIYELDSAPLDVERGQVGVTMTLSGAKIMEATDALAGVAGVAAVLQAANEPE